ncbi:Radical SAM domain-containing protein [Halococcus saccharolyticus DSM 5350]|uniref:Radical SAM domain-containing protein n=2 Tax=Halococcus saccharolyticus TaxID=62319 RepID=M0MBL0_9EURY|nr:Radical SAM domain-containing protein [Halococcus saccharolyticus DSM 5350]
MRLETSWEADDSFHRDYYIEDGEGKILEKFGDFPTLDQLRQAEYEHNERIDLTNIGAPCANCGKEIKNRFAADPRGNLLCWDCAATRETEGTEAGVRVNTDPTKATYSQSHLYEKSLCDYVINVATGCRHGCKFCYVPTTAGYKAREEMLNNQAEVSDLQREWGSYLLYRDDLPERLSLELEESDFGNWRKTDRGRGIVMISSGTDPYQDRRAAQITRGVVRELCSKEIPTRILTRSTIAARDADLFSEFSDTLTIGSSIPSFNEDMVKALEPGAPPPLKRWKMLDSLRTKVPLYVSMSPTYPSMNQKEIHQLLTRFKALQPSVVFHEPINPRGSNFEIMVETLENSGFEEHAKEFQRLQYPQNWVEYSLKHLNLVQKEGQRLNAPPIHSWPDRELLKATSGSLRDQLAAMRQAISPEPLGDEPASGKSSAQSPLFDDYSEIEHLVKPSKLR